MRQLTFVTDRRTDGLASWHKREMYIITSRAKNKKKNAANYRSRFRLTMRLMMMKFMHGSAADIVVTATS